MPQKSTALGTGTLAALVVANMVGAGVFTTSGFALSDLGSPGRVMAAWVVGGLLALTGAWSYGMLARLIPESGGEYLFLSRNLHPGAGFIAGWVSLLAGFTGAIAFAALTFAAYALPSSGPGTASLVATGVIGIAVVLHALGVRQGAWVQNLAVGIKIILMLAFAAYAIRTPGVANWEGLAEWSGGAYAIPAFSIATFALSLMWISFSYSGFNAAVYLAGEVPEARVRIPRALMLGTAATMGIYLVLNAVFVLVPPMAAVAGQEDVATPVALVVGGQVMARLLGGVVALALFTSVSAMIMIGPRVYARMATDGVFPRWLRFESGTPVAAILVQGGLAITVVWIAELRELLSYLGFTLGLSTATTVASLFVVARRRGQTMPRLPGYPIVPAVFVTFTLLFAILGATVNPWEMLASVVTIGTGGLLYLAAARKPSG
jgi:APA family basic amino acid/polyamine antiporter